MADPNEIVFEASTDDGGDAGGQDDICLGNVHHAVGQQQQQVRFDRAAYTKRDAETPLPPLFFPVPAAYSRAHLATPPAPARGRAA